MDAPGFIPSLIGAPLSPAGGAVAGTVEDVLLDPASHRPVWLLVRLRDEAPPYTFVPAQRMASRADAVVVPFDETAMRHAPVRLAAPAACRPEDAAALGRHYGVPVPSGEARPLHAAPARVSRVAA
ncbi:MAG TPA: PRC-barrel domain-containing protein [Solirubrobacteraceae bacterium]